MSPSPIRVSASLRSHLLAVLLLFAGILIAAGPAVSKQAGAASQMTGGPTQSPTKTPTRILCVATPTPLPQYTGIPPASGIIQRQVSHCMDDAYVLLGATPALFFDLPYVRMGGLIRRPACQRFSLPRRAPAAGRRDHHGNVDAISLVPDGPAGGGGVRRADWPTGERFQPCERLARPTAAHDTPRDLDEPEEQPERPLGSDQFSGFWRSSCRRWWVRLTGGQATTWRCSSTRRPAANR